MANIKLFEEKQVRSVWNEEEEQWYFSVIDVVGILTDQPTIDRAKKYWSVLKSRLKKEGNETTTNCSRLKLPAADGKMRLTDVANIKDLLRIIQSIPSPKAEPFKLWLAKVGAERIEEIENPEIAQVRAHDIYRQKGYSEEWIERRMRGIETRNELTDAWSEHGVEQGKEYAILTNEISQATFGVTVGEHKAIKSLNRENLRDHMTKLELLFTELGEASTAAIVNTRNPQGLGQNKLAAREGGKIAGDARKALEEKSGISVVSDINYKELPQAEVEKLIEDKVKPE